MILAAAALTDTRGRWPPRGLPPGDDPLAPLVLRIERYLQAHEVNGVTMDWRYQVDPAEEIRQTVVCQLLACAELYRIRPTPRLLGEIHAHADFLIGRLDRIRSHRPFDGMLAYGLLAAYEVTRDRRYRDAGAQIAADLAAIPTEKCVLNPGLMVAMATAEYARLGGGDAYAQKARDILTQLIPSQNEDGSFPHWCSGSRDIHYTGWMAMELIHLQRLLGDPRIEPMLERMSTFLEQRIGADGRARYEEPCPEARGGRCYYFSRKSGCALDYDTRGWTVEPAYCVLLFDRERSPRYSPTLRFLLSLERGGTFPDLYGYRPPPTDPEYPWTTADTSVVNTSIIFWTLATALAERGPRAGAAWRSTRAREVVPEAAVVDFRAWVIRAEWVLPSGTDSLRVPVFQPLRVGSAARCACYPSFRLGSWPQSRKLPRPPPSLQRPSCHSIPGDLPSPSRTAT